MAPFHHDSIVLSVHKSTWFFFFFLHIDKATRNAPLNCHNCHVCEGLESGAIFTQNYLQLLRKTA